MKLEAIYNELAEIAKQHDIKIRKESGLFKGGLCIVNNERHIVVNKNMPLEIMTTVIADCLSTLDLSNQYMKPAVRELLERRVA